MPLLCLRLLSEARTTDEGWSLGAEWLIREDGGAIRGQGVTDFRGLTDLLDPSQGWIADPDNVLILIPHALVLELNVTVPGRSAAQIRRALPYAVEEFATTDIEDLHIATDVIRPGKQVRTQLIEQSFIRGWVDCLRALGIEPGALCVDTELLEVEEGCVTVLIDGTGALIRSAAEAAAVDRSNLLVALSSLETNSVRIINGELQADEEAGLAGRTLEYVDTSESPLQYLVSQWRPAAAINLLQGPFAPPRKKNTTGHLWSRVGAVAAAWSGLVWILMIAEGFWASSRADALESEANALYASWFPDEGAVRNPRLSLAEKLGQSADTTGPGFPALTTTLAAALDPSAAVRSIEFDQQGGELRVEVVMQNHAEVESLRTRLTASGLNAELLNATQEENTIRAMIVMRQPS
jgi:general secretion pathway protein L